MKNSVNSVTQKKWCIYRITNLINGKTYIGQHKYSDINDSYFGSGKLLKQAFKKYGKENFKKDILVQDIKTLEEANFLEKKYILQERIMGKSEYNIHEGGTGGAQPIEIYNNPERLRKLSQSLKNFYKNHPEAKEKIRQKNFQRYQNIEERIKTAKATKSALSSEDIRKKISENTRIALSDDKVRKSMSEGLRKYYSNPENLKKFHDIMEQVRNNNPDIPEKISKSCLHYFENESDFAKEVRIQACIEASNRPEVKEAKSKAFQNNKWYYHKDTLKQKRFKEDPGDPWVLGKLQGSTTGTRWYHNILTLENRCFRQPPDSNIWVLGMIRKNK